MKSVVLIFSIIMVFAVSAAPMHEYAVSQESFTYGCLEPGDHNIGYRKHPLYIKILNQENVEIIEFAKKALILKVSDNEYIIFDHENDGYSKPLIGIQHMMITASDEGYELEFIKNPLCNYYIKFSKK